LSAGPSHDIGDPLTGDASDETSILEERGVQFVEVRPMHGGRLDRQTPSLRHTLPERCRSRFWRYNGPRIQADAVREHESERE